MGNSNQPEKKGPRPPQQNPPAGQANVHGAGAGAGGQGAARPAQPAAAGAPASSSGGGGGAAPAAASASAAAASSRGETGSGMNHRMTVNDFDLLKVVGKGSFGKVMQVRKKDTGTIYAMKVLNKQHLVARKQVAHTQTERKVLENIDHPFIVSLRYAFQNEEKLYMILDYFTGGELFFHLKNTGRFPEERAMFYAAEITSALECLHAHDIVYRDLKPENVLLDDEGHIRLTDFGLSKESVSSDSVTHTFCGTPEYLAPEVIRGSGYGKAVDWWSLGTLLYEMLTGLPPFYNQNLHVMYEKIIRGRLTFPDYMSREARSLLQGLLERNPKVRLGSGPRGVEEIKSHPFFRSVDWEALKRKEIQPSFRPANTGGKMDTSNVDDEFKREVPKDTPVKESQIKAVQFPDFTYKPPPSLMVQGELHK